MSYRHPLSVMALILLLFGATTTVPTSAETRDCVTAFAFSADGQYATGHCDASVRIWDIATDELLFAFPALHFPLMTEIDELWVYDLSFSSDGQRLAISFRSNFNMGMAILHVRDTITRQLIIETSFAHAAGPVDWHPDGSQFAILGGIGLGMGARTELYLYKRNGSELHSINTNGNSILGLDWHPDGTYIAHANGLRVNIWDTTTWEPVDWTVHDPSSIDEEMPSYSHHLLDVAWSSDGSKLAMIDSEAVYIWDTTSGEQVAAFPKRGGKGLFRVAWSPDDAFLASDSENVIEIWNAETGTLAFTIDSDYISDLAWRPDGILFYTDGKLQSFDPRAETSEE